MAIRPLPVAAAELMDRASLASVTGKPGMPDFLEGLAPGVTALLVETRAESADDLQSQITRIKEGLQHLNPVRPIAFTAVPQEFTQLWKIRKGLFPAVGAVRQTGTTEIPFLDSGEPLLREQRHFFEVATGRAEPLVSLGDGLAAMQLVERVRAAAGTPRA